MIDRPKRISKRKLAEIYRRVSEQDKHTLMAVRVCRFITSRQIMRLPFMPHTYFGTGAKVRTVNRHLFRLDEWGLIAHLDRRIGGIRAGSGANIWYLDTAGHRLLQLDELSKKHSRSAIRKRHHEPTLYFLEHHLAVSEVYVQLHEIAGQSYVELVQVNLEPDCWRECSNILGGRNAILKPDLYAVTAAGEYEDHWFIEVDLATESPSTVIRKCEQYVRYYQNGTEQRTQGVFPRVVWIVPTSKRKDSLLRHIDENFSGQLRHIFVVITLDELPELLRNDHSIREVKEP
jgi:hypothetical protein